MSKSGPFGPLCILHSENLRIHSNKGFIKGVLTVKEVKSEGPKVEI